MPETIRIDFNNLPFTEFLREIFGGQVHKVVTQLFTMKIEIFFCFRMNKLVELAYSNHFSLKSRLIDRMEFLNQTMMCLVDFFSVFFYPSFTFSFTK